MIREGVKIVKNTKVITNINYKNLLGCSSMKPFLMGACHPLHELIEYYLLFVLFYTYFLSLFYNFFKKEEGVRKNMHF